MGRLRKHGAAIHVAAATSNSRDNQTGHARSRPLSFSPAILQVRQPRRLVKGLHGVFTFLREFEWCESKNGEARGGRGQPRHAAQSACTVGRLHWPFSGKPWQFIHVQTPAHRHGCSTQLAGPHPQLTCSVSPYPQCSRYLRTTWCVTPGAMGILHARPRMSEGGCGTRSMTAGKKCKYRIRHSTLRTWARAGEPSDAYLSTTACWAALSSASIPCRRKGRPVRQLPWRSHHPARCEGHYVPPAKP